MKISKTIKRLSIILLTGVFAVGPIAMRCYAQSASQAPSPVRTNALALIAELERPSTCPPDDTICVSQIESRKLSAAIEGLKSIIRIDEQREGIIADMQARIDIRGGIIEDFKKIDQNSQTIDLRGTEISAVWREQHADNKRMITDLQQDLDSCRSNQKWVFTGGALVGGIIVWKYKDRVTSFQNPFVSAQVAQPSFLNFQAYQSTAEERVRQAFKASK